MMADHSVWSEIWNIAVIDYFSIIGQIHIYNYLTNQLINQSTILNYLPNQLINQSTILNYLPNQRINQSTTYQEEL